MTNESAFSLIVVRTEDGRQLSLYNEAQCEAAVASGDVTAKSSIVVYVGATGATMNAVDHPAFGSLAPPPPPPADLPSVVVDVGLAVDEPTPEVGEGLSFDDDDLQPSPQQLIVAPEVRPSPAAEPLPPVPPRPVSPAGATLRNALLALGALFALGYCASRNVGSSPNASLGNDSVTTAGEPTPTASDVDMTANLPLVTRYTVRDVNVQTAPTSGVGVGKLDRGAEVTGVMVAGSLDAAQRWMKLRSGSFDGRYIWAANLSEVAPPSLDTSFAGTKMAFVAGTIRTAPAADASEIADPAFPVGRTFTVAGKVNDSWAEIQLKHGGVGYVEAAVFNPPAESAAGSRHNILVSNECLTKSYTLAIYYEAEDGWHANDGALWTMPAGRSFYPSIANVSILTTNPTIYYAVTEVNGHPNAFNGSFHVQYGNLSLNMRQAVLTYMENGDYKIALSC